MKKKTWTQTNQTDTSTQKQKKRTLCPWRLRCGIGIACDLRTVWDRQTEANAPQKCISKMSNTAIISLSLSQSESMCLSCCLFLMSLPLSLSSPTVSGWGSQFFCIDSSCVSQYLLRCLRVYVSVRLCVGVCVCAWRGTKQIFTAVKRLS